MAERLGMLRQQYQQYEKGTVEPTVQVAARIAEALGITIDELAGRTSEPKVAARRALSPGRRFGP